MLRVIDDALFLIVRGRRWFSECESRAGLFHNVSEHVPRFISFLVREVRPAECVSAHLHSTDVPLRFYLLL